ncbi:hypothetical protein [Argonema antarcticum]|uniref:hypothetical protein n=1 Tax=Argonema antarcticum TaxID=2942763 RepID=UPI002013B2DE|nr:hypothetical protein [Argonema antarcticum]MCL1474427.1 hypothetical protein [Argonema antarcticum A004/B2]
MPVAFSQETITQQWSAALLRASLTTKLVALGFSQEAGTSGNELHFSIDAPLTSAPKDRAYIRIIVDQSSATNIKVQAWGGDGYSANSLQNQWPIFADAIGNPVNIGYGSNENFPVKICTFKSNEIALVSGIKADNNVGAFNIGFFFPATKADWWDNNAVFAFTPNDGSCYKFRSPAIVPYHVTYSDINVGSDQGASNVNVGGSRDLEKRLKLNQTVGNRNIIGQTSADFGLLGAGNLPPLNQSQIDGEFWVNLNSNCSVSLRIA